MANTSLFADSLFSGDGDLGDAPRYCDFNNLDQERADMSAWFDSHESFYPDATFLHEKTPKRKRGSSKLKKSSSSRSLKKTTASSKPRSTARSASLARPALQPYNGQADDQPAASNKYHRKRAASVAQIPRHAHEDKENLDAQLGQIDQTASQKKGIVRSEALLGLSIPFSPIPQSKQIDHEEIDQRILQRMEEQRRARKKASVAHPSEVLPSLRQHNEPEAAPAEVVQEAATTTTTAEKKTDDNEGESEQLPHFEQQRPARPEQKRPHMASASNRVPVGRAAGKHVPVAKVLQQQRTKRLVDEMNKQRDRAKAQREQMHARTKLVEAAKKEREQERLARIREKQEQMEQLKKQRELEKEQRLREREQREAEKRERKLARIAEKQHRQPLPIKEKQLLQEELAVRSVKPLTCPKEFRFATEARSRSHKAKPERTSPVKEIRPVKKAKTSGVAGKTTKAITKPKAFVFSTEARAALRRPHQPSADAERAASAPTKRRRKIEN